MESLHRSACDECHDRKIKCSTSGPGACLNCQGTGRVCTFSPRDEMGRPRKTGRRAKDRSTADGKTSSKSAAQKRSSVSDKKEEQRPLTPSRSCSHNDLGALPQPAQHDTFQLADNDFDMMSQNDFTFILENQANFSSSAQHSYSPSNDSSINYFQHHNQVPRQEQLLLTPPISEHSKAADKSLTFLSHTDGSALSPDVYRQLSRLLFTLRQEYNRPWSVPGMFGTEDYTARPGKEIFESASSLCDILHAVITGKSTENEPIRPPQHPMDHEDTHGVFVLALMGVAMLLDIYRLLGRTHSWAASPNPDYTDLSVTGQTPGAAGTGGASISSMLHHHMDPSGGSMGAGRSFTANHLTSILQLTTMDFHLARLASMLGDVSCGRDSAIGMQRMVKPLGGLEVADLLMEIKRTREEMRGSAESLLVKA